MSVKSKKSSFTSPLENAITDFDALFDSMIKAAQPHVDRIWKSHDTMMAFGERGDWARAESEMENWEAHHAAAIEASGAVTPTAKQSTGGKLRAKQRRDAAADARATIRALFDVFIREGKKRHEAVAQCAKDLHRPNSEINRALRNPR